MPTDLSLGKLRRATDPANVDVNNTANSKLAEDAAGTTSDNSDVSMSAFAIDSSSNFGPEQVIVSFELVTSNTVHFGGKILQNDSHFLLITFQPISFR